jgi:chaperonin cofactor prefoldin
MTLTEGELKERIERLEKRFEAIERLMKDLSGIIRQMDRDLTPMRLIGPGLLPKNMEGK